MFLHHKRLGRTGLYVTAMGLGAYQLTGEFGVHYDEARKILDYALNSGVNYIDTAQMYGFGEGEELVGQALRRHSGKNIPPVQAELVKIMNDAELNLLPSLARSADKEGAAQRRVIIDWRELYDLCKYAMNCI